MLQTLAVRNFKSIVDLSIDLGRFNVFIGENGCGKSNILEALAMLAAATTNRLGHEDLPLRGIRVAKPSMMANAFGEIAPDVPIEVAVKGGVKGSPSQFWKKCHLLNQDGAWIDLDRAEAVEYARAALAKSPTFEDPVKLEMFLSAISERPEGLEEIVEYVAQRFGIPGSHPDGPRGFTLVRDAVRSFAVYCADTQTLRGLQRQSLREPLGLYGEGLDTAILQMPKSVRDDLVRRARAISWLDDIEVDASGARKLLGDKLGRSESELYFADKFLSEDRCIFSAENANEGILHMLFHLVLFMHPKSPPLLAIDNLEGTLNPRLCRVLTAELVELAKANDRQALVTTHNPAVLDGINLHDEEQRLFVVSRNDEGHTRVKRVQLKPKIEGEKPAMLSELWMRGHIGGLPKLF